MTDVQTTEAAAPAQNLDLLGAAALFAEREEQQQQQPEPQEQAADTQPEQAAAEEAPQASEITQEGEQPEEPAREAEPEPEAYDLDKIHGNTKIRLRDGSAWTAADLKRRIGDLQDIEKHRASFQEELQKFQTERSQTAQERQLIAQIAPQAIAAIQASLPQVPPPPTPDIESSDPFKAQEMWGAHLRAKADFDAKVNQMRQIQFAQQQAHAQAQAEQARQLQQVVQAERQKLLEKFPEFADAGKAKEFQANFVKYGREYGFTDQELGQVYDSRLIGVMKDAMAWRQLQAQPKPRPNQPKQVTQTAPVQQPGKRATTQEAKAVQRQELFQKARQVSHDPRAMAEIWAQLEN